MHEGHDEFSAAETRGIGSFPGNRVVADSRGRGWRDVHATLAAVDTWSGVHLPHAHDCIAYCVSQPAYLRCRVDGSETAVTLKPRQFFLIPGGRPSEWHRRGPSEMLMIYLRREMLGSLANQLSSLSDSARGEAEIALPLGASDGLLEQFALSVLSVLREDEDGSSALYVDSLARATALHLLRGRSGARPKGLQAGPSGHVSSSRLRRVIDYIEAEIGGDLSLGALARRAALPEATFGRAFRDAYGTSPHRYVMTRRLDRARTLLLSSDKPLAEIAMDTGFSSQSHFTTAFGRFAGSTPAEFRRHGAGTTSALARS